MPSTKTCIFLRGLFYELTQVKYNITNIKLKLAKNSTGALVAAANDGLMSATGMYRRGVGTSALLS